MKTLYKIAAGLLTLGVIAYGATQANFFNLSQTAQAVGDVVIDWGVPTGQPIFTVTAAAPGQTESRNVQVTNNASVVRPLGVRGTATDVDPVLADALTMEITDGTTALYGPVSLSQFFTDSANPDGIMLTTLDPGQTLTLSFTVTFDETAENDSQNTMAVFDITLGISAEVPTECSSITFSGSPIFGTERSDSIRGTAGNDLIFGLEGSDSIRGLGGDDCIVGGPGSDSLRGGLGKDEMYGNEGSDSLRGEENDDKLFGGEGSDELRGEDGNDQAFGEAGSDSLRGGDGNDTLTGGADSDSARGESGTDTCDAESERTCEL